MELLNEECLLALSRIPDELIDLTVTSPPYDGLRNYEESLIWCKGVWEAVIYQLFRVTKKGGVVVWVVGDATVNGSETGTSFKQALYAIECGFRLHDTMIYSKARAPLNHNRYEQHFEYMFVWSKGAPNIFNGIRETCKHSGRSRKNNKMRQDSDFLSSRSAQGVVNTSKLKNNIFNYAIGGCCSRDKDAYDHPAIFPEYLAGDQILTWSDPGSIVLDLFMGSGTTGKMALSYGREFVGIEKVKKYYDIAERRVCSAWCRPGLPGRLC